jgi:hypothetical protein
LSPPFGQWTCFSLRLRQGDAVAITGISNEVEATYTG